ncbi:hypothetical protein L3X38_012625 [Prunus dulcis]|uniref:Uncharacterized protein n=1 Tax=Prunus dulcis TaxID=3755 RepID=A0AAD4WJM7_PRUDU|nr:hypothetical protein L3X38_012625 [Prunus dulcis]
MPGIDPEIACHRLNADPIHPLYCWSRISFNKKYLHRFLTEVRTLPGSKENSEICSRGRTMEEGFRVLGFGHAFLALCIPSPTSW